MQLFRYLYFNLFSPKRLHTEMEGLEPEPASLQTNNQTMKPHVNPVKLKNAQLIESKVKEGKIQVNLKCFNSY